MQTHLAASLAEFAGSAGYREDRVLLVVEWSLDGDLALVQSGRLNALPRLAHDGAGAPPVVAADLVGIGLVVDVVGEG